MRVDWLHGRHDPRDQPGLPRRDDVGDLVR